jgi:nucleotide-binding universal stress UspA family protein
MSQTQGPRILVALDPGKRPEDPLMLGVRLARLASAPLDVVSVFLTVPMETDDKFMAEAREATEAQLHEIAGRVEGASVAHVRAVGAVSRARGLQQLSEQDEIGLVVIGSTTRGPLRRTLPGSIADRLLSGAAASVAIAPHGFADEPPPRLASLGVAYDGSAESQAALEGGRRLARKAGAHLRVITVHQRSRLAASPRPPLAWNRSMPRSSVSSGSCWTKPSPMKRSCPSRASLRSGDPSTCSSSRRAS